MANHHPRVDILRPGPGVGGHCIAVDPWFIVDAAPEQAAPDPRRPRVNDHMPAHTAEQIVATSPAVPGAAGRLPRPVVQGGRRRPAGQPGGGDRRARSPRRCPTVKILAVEPHAAGAARTQLDAARQRAARRHRARRRDADVIVLLTDHSCFRAIRRSQLAGKVVYDTRGMWA